MLKTELGPVLWNFGTGIATLSLTPAADRAAMVRRIAITAPSATDNWVVTVEGKPIMVFRVRSTGNQNIVRKDTTGTPRSTTFFDFCRRYLGMDPSVPVPLGQTLTVASVGGATADIFIEFEEHDNSDVNTSLLNHPQGNEWLIPIYTFLNAGQTTAGTISDDTQVGPAWLQPFLIGTMVTSAWRLSILACFLQGIGVNTFSGAANHQSASKAKHIVRNGIDLFGRPGPGGIPNVGTASAAGSANTAFGQAMGAYPAWESDTDLWDNVLAYPLVIKNGDTVNVKEEITGDLTGTASYEPDLAVWIARVSQLVGA